MQSTETPYSLRLVNQSTKRTHLAGSQVQDSRPHIGRRERSQVEHGELTKRSHALGAKGEREKGRKGERGKGGDERVFTKRTHSPFASISNRKFQISDWQEAGLTDEAQIFMEWKLPNEANRPNVVQKRQATNATRNTDRC